MTRLAPTSSAPPDRSHRSVPGAVLAAVIGAASSMVLVFYWALAATLVGGVAVAMPLGKALLFGLAIGAVIGLFRRRRDTPALWVLLVGAASAAAWLLLSGGRPLGSSETGAFWGVVMTFATFLAAAYLTRYGLRQIDLGQGGKKHVVEQVVVRLLRGGGFALFLLLILFPFYFMLASSLKSRASMLADPTDLSIDFGQGLRELVAGYTEVLFTYDFLNFIGNSALVAFVTMVVTLVLAVLGAYAVTRLRFPGQTALSRSILLIYMFPAIVLVIPLYAVFTQLGLRNTLPGLLIVYPASTIPVALYMLRSYFQTLPKDLEEAGLIDGCTRAQVIWRITLPLSTPALASVGLYVFMIAWNEFLFAFMFLDNPAIFTLPRGMVMLNSQEVPRQYLMAGAMIITVPIMVLFFWFEKYLVGGLTAGGVKG